MSVAPPAQTHTHTPPHTHTPCDAPAVVTGMGSPLGPAGMPGGDDGGGTAVSTGHSPVCHLRDDVVPVLVVCTEIRGGESGPPRPLLSPPYRAMGAALTRLPAAQVEGQPVGQLILALHQPLRQLVLGRLPTGHGRGDTNPGLATSPPPPQRNPSATPTHSPGVVDGRPPVDVGRTGVSAVHHQQLCLQDLPGLGSHVQRRGALLLRAQPASAPW